MLAHKKLLISLFIASAIFLFLPGKVSAQVVINEFSSNSDPEWVELFNTSTTQTVDLTAWQLTDNNNVSSDDLVLSGCISPRAFRTFSRSAGWLNNDGDTVNLKNNLNEFIDQVTYGGGGIVGIPTNGKSAGRDPDGSSNWRLFDVPSQTNTDCQLPTTALSPTSAFSSTPIPSLIPTQTASNTPTPVFYSNIYINEFLPDPESGNEKVEIKNANSFSVSLVDWQIDDIPNGGHSPMTFSAEISPSGLYTVDLGSASFLNNNESDSVRLLDFNGAEKDKKDYSSSTKNLSWAKDHNSNWCQQSSSFGSDNSDCPSATDAPAATPVPTSTPTPTPTIKPSLTPTKTPTPSLSLTPTPIGEVLGEEVASESALGQLSGEENGMTASSEESGNIKKFIFPALAAILGVAFIGFSIFSFLKSRRSTVV